MVDGRREISDACREIFHGEKMDYGLGAIFFRERFFWTILVFGGRRMSDQNYFPPVSNASNKNHSDTTSFFGSGSSGSASSPTPSPPSPSQQVPSPPSPLSPPPSSPPPASPPPPQSYPSASPPPSQQSPPPLSYSPPPGDYAPPWSAPQSQSPISWQSQPVPTTPSPPPPSQSQTFNPPPNPNNSPVYPNTPYAGNSTIPPPPPSSQDGAQLYQSPTLSPPSVNTSQGRRNASTTQSTDSITITGANASQFRNLTATTHETFKAGAIVGGSAGGIVAIALFAVLLCFVCRMSKRRRSDVQAAQYTPPKKFTVQSEGYYSKQKHNFVGGNGMYETQNQPIHSGRQSYVSYGSQKGTGFRVGSPDTQIGGSRIAFSYEELMEITNGFSRQNVLGEGGFGCVYKGVLSDGKIVAVKQLKAGSGQGDREFRAEVEIISRVHHRHLVSLVGYCISEKQRLLIYEFVPNNTLEHHLHGKGMPVLNWSKRIKIALGAARGLAYLHEDCHPRIIHRDIKAANILLDDAFEAQVADFGLAKLTDDTSTHVSTRVMGTFGYMAPEYASSGKLTDRSDVFSFGVMLLELVTGQKPVDPTRPLGDESLVEWARPLLTRSLDTGDMSELVDPRLEKHYVECQMLMMIEAAAACVRHSAPKRPRMKQLVRALDWESKNCDLSNGVKYGQSRAYDSGQYNQEILVFRRMAFGSEDGSDFNTSAEFSPEINGSNTWKCGETSSDYTSDELETRSLNHERRPGQGQSTDGHTGVNQW